MPMRRIILSPVACLAAQYFPTLFHKRHDCRVEVFERKIYILIFSKTSIRNISHPKTELNMIKIVHRSSCKVPVIRVSVLIKLEFSRRIFEKYSNAKFRENPPSGSHVDGRTDGVKLTVICRNFANVSEVRILPHIKH